MRGLLRRDWHQQSEARRDFERFSGGRAASIEHELTRHLDASIYLAGLFAAFPAAGREEFHEFALRLSGQHDDIEALMWVPEVKAAESLSVERLAGAEGVKNFTIHDDPDTKPRDPRQASHDTYFCAICRADRRK